ncbi:MAG: aminotransferase class IV [Cyanobacteria bacterium J06626_23]
MKCSFNSPAFMYGASVFTTVRTYGKSLDNERTQWAAHCDRISQSLRTFDWPQPDWASIRQGCEQLKQTYPILRITVFPDGRELITGRTLPANLSQQQTQGVTLWRSDNPLHRRSQPQHKTGNYLGCWLAIQQAQKHSARDAILTNENGDWLETSTGNLWGYKDGHWWTPPLTTGILPGIQRVWFIQKLRALGHPVIERPWTPDLPPQFEALAYTNCVIEYLPVHTVLMGKTKLKYDPNHPGLETLRSLLAMTHLES